MEKAPENGKESLHSAHANGMNEGMYCYICKIGLGKSYITINVYTKSQTVTIMMQLFMLQYNNDYHIQSNTTKHHSVIL
jgi:hypothetical protein